MAQTRTVVRTTQAQHVPDVDLPPPQPMQVSRDPEFKLYYFDIKARGEVIRLIFHAAGVDFADIRVGTQSWSQLKPGMPFGTLPVLEVEGHQLAQSMAIARFVATEFELRGRDLYEQALVDSVAEYADDLLSDYLKTVITDHPHQRGELKRRYFEETLPAGLRRLDMFQRTYSKEYGYVVGTTMTYADLAVYSLLDQLVTSGAIEANFLLQFRYCTELRKRVLTHGGLMNYFNRRPQTQI